MLIFCWATGTCLSRFPELFLIILSCVTFIKKEPVNISTSVNYKHPLSMAFSEWGITGETI